VPKLHLIAVAACLFAAPLPAKPLITSSEATLARICLKFGDTPERVLAACDGALIEPGVTEGLRADLAAARGDALAALDRQAEAEGAFRAALASNPNSTDALNGLAGACARSSGRTRPTRPSGSRWRWMSAPMRWPAGPRPAGRRAQSTAMRRGRCWRPR